MDDKIIGLYAAGLSIRDIRAHLEEVYGLKVSADLISRVSDAVLEDVPDWQNRALESTYPIVFLDALRVKSATRKAVRLKTLPFTWPWASMPRANGRFWGCGSRAIRGKVLALGDEQPAKPGG